MSMSNETITRTRNLIQIVAFPIVMGAALFLGKSTFSDIGVNLQRLNAGQQSILLNQARFEGNIQGQLNLHDQSIKELKEELKEIRENGPCNNR